MPPKKLKVEEKKVQTTPVKARPQAQALTPVEKTPQKDTPKKATSRKTQPTIIDFKPVPADHPEASGPLPIDISTEYDNGLAVQDKGHFRQLLRLQGGNSFNVYKTILLSTSLDLSAYEGYQAVLIRPAKPFQFSRLPDEARVHVFRHYFASADDTITLEGKRPNKDAYAKAYAEGLKDRVAILAVNKAINKEATPILYSYTLKFDSTATLVDFFTQVEKGTRARVTSVFIKTYSRASAKNALSLLADSVDLKTLHIASGICTEDDVVKAVKVFYGDSKKFLESMDKAKGNTAAGIDLLSFGKDAFMHKTDDKKNSSGWKKDMVEEFREKLKAKLRASYLRAWVCVCGSLVEGHNCAEEFGIKKKRLVQHEKELWMHIEHGGDEVLALV